jgi:hypothetical protein
MALDLGFPSTAKFEEAIMASEIDEVFFDVEAVGGPSIPRLYEYSARVVTTAHPFNEDDLRAFAAAGEHPGFD